MVSGAACVSLYSAAFSVYCPAGCKNATGDVWGNSEQGYRDVSTKAFMRPNCSVFNNY